MPTLPLELRESFVWWRILAYVVSAVCLLGATVVFTIFAETTPHVYQASGYGDIAADKSIWFVLPFEHPFSIFDFYEHFIKRFWFFAARNNPETAPLVTWFNGGVSGAD